MPNSNPFKLAVLATTFLVLPSLAMAQQEPTQRDLERQRLEQPGPFDPLGIRSGSFFIFPKIDLSANYDTNVFASEDDEEDDIFFELSPRIDVKSNFSRHALNFTVGADFGFYDEFDDNNYEDFDLGVDGALDISRSDIAKGALAFARKHESRDSPDDAGGAEPVTYFQTGLDASYRHDFNRIFALGRLKLVQLDFEDTDTAAGESNQDDRDRLETVPGLRIGYQVSPSLAAFVDADYRLVKYKENEDDDGFERDSQGFTARVGAEFNLTRLLTGEAGIGYTRQEYEDDRLDAAKGVSGNAAVTWRPTQLTTVSFKAAAEVLETTIGFDGDIASSVFEKRIGIDVSHELRRNIFVNGGASYARDDFEGTDRSDDVFRANIGATYLITRNIGVTGGYEFSARDSNAEGEEFSRSLFRLGITARL